MIQNRESHSCTRNKSEYNCPTYAFHTYLRHAVRHEYKQAHVVLLSRDITAIPERETGNLIHRSAPLYSSLLPFSHLEIPSNIFSLYTSSSSFLPPLFFTSVVPSGPLPIHSTPSPSCSLPLFSLASAPKESRGPHSIPSKPLLPPIHPTRLQKSRLANPPPPFVHRSRLPPSSPSTRTSPTLILPSKE